MTSWDPVPRMPAVCHTSATSASLRRQRHQRRIDALAALDDGTDDHPVGVHDSGRPRPPAGQPDAAVDHDCPAGGRQWRRGQDRPRSEHLFLGLDVEQREHPVVQGVEAQRPSARGASVRHPPDRVQQLGELGLATAEPCRKQQRRQPASFEVTDRGRGQSPQPLGFVGPLSQRGDELGADSDAGRAPPAEGMSAP